MCVCVCVWEGVEGESHIVHINVYGCGQHSLPHSKYAGVLKYKSFCHKEVHIFNPLNIVTYGHIKLTIVTATIYICSQLVHTLCAGS